MPPLAGPDQYLVLDREDKDPAVTDPAGIREGFDGRNTFSAASSATTISNPAQKNQVSYVPHPALLADKFFFIFQPLLSLRHNELMFLSHKRIDGIRYSCMQEYYRSIKKKNRPLMLFLRGRDGILSMHPVPASCGHEPGTRR